MRPCLLILATCLSLAAADHAGVTVSASSASGFLAVTAEGGEAPFITIPVDRILDMAMGDSYQVEGKDIPIRHLAIRVETLNPMGVTKVDTYRVRISDQSPESVRREISAAR